MNKKKYKAATVGTQQHAEKGTNFTQNIRCKQRIGNARSAPQNQEK